MKTPFDRPYKFSLIFTYEEQVKFVKIINNIKIMLLLLKYKRSIKSAKRLLLEFEVSSDSLLLPYLILFNTRFPLH